MDSDSTRGDAEVDADDVVVDVAVSMSCDTNCNYRDAAVRR